MTYEDLPKIDHSKVFAYYCECQGDHAFDCYLVTRLRVKERICDDHGIINYIPEEIAAMIDVETDREYKKIIDSLQEYYRLVGKNKYGKDKADT
jgi:hypothetical protein